MPTFCALHGQAVVSSIARHPSEPEITVSASHPSAPDSHAVLQFRPHSCLPTSATPCGATPVASVGYMRRAGAAAGPSTVVCLSASNTLHMLEVGVEAGAVAGAAAGVVGGAGAGAGAPAAGPDAAPSLFTAVFGDSLAVPVATAGAAKRQRVQHGGASVLPAAPVRAAALPINEGMPALTSAWLTALAASVGAGAGASAPSGNASAGSRAGVRGGALGDGVQDAPSFVAGAGLDLGSWALPSAGAGSSGAGGGSAVGGSGVAGAGLGAGAADAVPSPPVALATSLAHFKSLFA
jgi:hypothetical protein